MQVHVEIEYYFIKYFKHSVGFDALYIALSFTKGGAHTHFIDSSDIHAFRSVHISPALTRSLTLQHFDLDDALEICNKTLLNFYPILLHM